jgi:hypothetical protein
VTTPWNPTNPAAPRPPLGVTGLLTQTFRLLFARFTTLFPLAFVPALVLALLNWGVSAPIPADFDPMVDPLPLPSWGELLLGLASTVIGFFIIGFMCLAALDAVMGRSHTIAEYTRQALRQLLPIGVLGILLSIGAGIGAVFFIVPGLYILARFLPWVEAVVFEDAGWSGLSRAQDLTEGYRWPLVGAVIAMAVIVLALILLISPLAYLVVGSGLLSALLEAVVSGLYYALIAIFTALVYARLRAVREGLSIEQIAATIG